jgi:hypothetical protein
MRASKTGPAAGVDAGRTEHDATLCRSADYARAQAGLKTPEGALRRDARMSRRIAC